MFTIISAMVVAMTGQITDIEALTTVIERRSPRFSNTRKMKGSIRRRVFASQYAFRIVLESERRGLDPLVMAVIATIESDWRWWIVSTDGHNSQGVWQLTPYDSPLVAARKRLLGCAPGPRIPRRWIRWWMIRFRGKNKPCDDQLVASRRVKFGRWTNRELRDPVIGTFIVAHEIANHIRACKKSWKCKRYKRVLKRCSLSRSTQRRIGWYAQYNSGPNRPRYWYLYKLFRAYKKVLVEYTTLYNYTRATKVER